MLKKVSQARILSWQELDQYLNNIASYIFTYTKNEKIISYVNNRDRICAAILAEKLGYQLSDQILVNDNHFSIFGDCNKVLQNSLSGGTFCIYFLKYELDSEYMKNKEPSFYIEDIYVPNGEIAPKLSVPYENRVFS